MKPGMIALVGAALIAFSSSASSQTVRSGQDNTIYGADGSAPSAYGNTPDADQATGWTSYGHMTSGPQDATPPASGSTSSGNRDNRWTIYGTTGRGANGSGCAGYAYMTNC